MYIVHELSMLCFMHFLSSEGDLSRKLSSPPCLTAHLHWCMLGVVNVILSLFLESH